MPEKTLPEIGSMRISRILMLSERKYQRFLSKTLKKNGVGLSEYPILLALYHTKNAGMSALSQTEIADRNIQDKALVTRAVKKLTTSGLVESSIDPNNK